MPESPAPRSARLAVLAAVALAAGAVGACAPPPPAGWSGYAEGEYVYPGASIGGTLTALPVRAGQAVARGALLFSLDAEAEQAARNEAAARLAAAEAQAADTGSGKRSDELAVARAQLAQAHAAADRAQRELERRQGLVAQGFIAPIQLDDVRAAAAQARERVAELDAALAVAKLPARPDERRAAAAQADAASEALRQTEWRRAQKTLHAPADAMVADTFFRVGEFVPAGQPVVSLLPTGAMKARFYVPEAEVAGLAVGAAVNLRCDGCTGSIAARVSRIATQPEYTPPVIYSNQQRAKLVFLVEARPEAAADAARLHPGQPLDVRRAGAAP